MPYDRLMQREEVRGALRVLFINWNSHDFASFAKIETRIVCVCVCVRGDLSFSV